MTLYTIGYEGIDIARFLSLLQEHDIETVVDISGRVANGDSGYTQGFILSGQLQLRQEWRISGDLQTTGVFQ